MILLINGCHCIFIPYQCTCYKLNDAYIISWYLVYLWIYMAICNNCYRYPSSIYSQICTYTITYDPFYLAKPENEPSTTLAIYS